MNWPSVPFGQLAEFRNGINYSRKNFGLGIKVIGVTNFQDYSKPHYEDLEEINPEGIVSENDILEDQDIVFVRSNGNKSLIGRTLFISSPPESVTFSGFCIRARFFNQDDCPIFYSFLFKSSLIRRTLSARSGGTNITNLNQKILSRLEVPFPPVPVRHRVASILSNYDDLIDNNNRRIALLEESVHRLYREWFVHLRFPGHERVAVVDGVPEGWEKKTLNDFSEDIRQRTHPSQEDPDTPYVGLEHIPRCSIALSQWGYCRDIESSKFKFKKGDILFGKIRAYFHKVVPAPFSGICSSDTIVIRPLSDDFYELVLAVASSKAFVDFAAKTAREGSNMPRANWKVMKQYPILYPSKDVLLKFNEFVGLSTRQIEQLIFMNGSLREARDRLLPRLMNGTLTV